MRAQTKPEYRNVRLADNGTITGERLVKGGPRRKMDVITVTPQGTMEETVEVGGKDFWVGFTTSIEGGVVQAAYYGSELGFQAILALQDGYGQAGYVPVQGPDWSGVRDSSPEAWAAMFKVAQQFVSVEQFLSELGLAEPTHS